MGGPPLTPSQRIDLIREIEKRDMERLAVGVDRSDCVCRSSPCRASFEKRCLRGRVVAYLKANLAVNLVAKAHTRLSLGRKR